MIDEKEVKRVMKEYNTDRLTALFILSIETGESQGDVISDSDELTQDERG